MKNILILIFLVFISCGDTIKTEKDKFSYIPEFPKFENDILFPKSIFKIELQPLKRFHRTTQNSFNLAYAVKNSSLYVITYYNDDEFPEEAFSNYKYYLTLLKITNGEIEIEKKWIDDNFDFNFWLKPNDDILLGKKIYSAKGSYTESIKNDSVKIDTLNDIEFQLWNKDFRENEKKTIEKNKQSNFEEFDKVIVGSNSKLEGGWNNGFETQDYPIYLSYYTLKWKNKNAKTKIDFNKNKTSPIFIKTTNNLYYIQYDEKLKMKSNAKEERLAKFFIVNEIQ